MKNIKIIILDVDGTLTDGNVYIDNNGVESKSFSIKDGLAIVQAIKYKIPVAIVTGRKSKIVEIRAKELGIEEVHQGIDNKVDTIKDIVQRYGFEFNEVAYIGDDINDLKVMKLCGFSASPEDAAEEVKDYVDYISMHKGGQGAVRDILKKILIEKGLWDKILDNY